MLLNRFFERIRRDEGVALAAVMGVMAVGLIVTTVVLTSVVAGIGFTTSSRAGVQAQAAAEAGIATARAGIAAGTCTEAGGAPSYASATGAVPRFVATIWRPAGGGGWEQRCPVGTTTQVRILSTGYAQSTGVGQSSGNTAVLEAILSATSAPTSIQPSGPAIYAYSSSGFGGGGTLYSVDGTSPNVMVKTGNVTCNGGANGVSDLVVESGNLSVEGGCNITGNVWSSGRTTLSGGVNVGGNVVANGVTQGGGGTVGGSVWSTLDVTVNGGGRISGTAVGQSLSLTNGRIGGDAWIFGSTVIDWGGYAEKALTTKSFSIPSGQPNDKFVGGKVTVVASGPGQSSYSAIPTRPVVPNWYNFSYDMSKWSGFTEIVMSGDCSVTQVRNRIASLGANPGVIDARACTNGITIAGGDKVTLSSDLAIIANKMNFSGGGGFRSDTARRLWLITPDANPNNTVPDCPSGASFVMEGGFDFSSTIGTLIYSPCAVTIGSGINTLRGQVFVGAATIDGGANIGYQKIGIPGVDLNSGAAPTAPTGPAARTLVSLRNVTG